MIITSKDNPTIKRIRKLRNKKYIKDSPYFLVEGINLIKEAKLANKLNLIISTNKTCVDAPHILVSKEVLATLSTLVNPLDIGLVYKLDSREVTNNTVLALDSISDPGNMGTIIRTAVAFSVTDILIENCASIYNDKVIRASEGSIFKANIIECNLFDKLSELKNEGYKILSTDLKSSNTQVNRFPKSILVVGNETKGVRKELIDISDYSFKIDIDNIESLNVSIATAILLYELTK